MREAKRERILLNRNNYRFTEDEFEIISKKTSRNLIEHLDERNLTNLNDRRKVGGFNVIFPDSNPQMIEAIKCERE